jgi:hypothetical protein
VRIAFHEDPIQIDALCADLVEHGIVYWHTMRPNFRRVQDLVREHGVDAIGLAAKMTDGTFNSYLLNFGVASFELSRTSQQVAAAIAKWESLGEPVPYVETLM